MLKLQFSSAMLQLFAILSGCMEENRMDGCRGKLEAAKNTRQPGRRNQSGGAGGRAGNQFEDISGKVFCRGDFGIGCSQYITMLRIASKAKEYLRDWDKGGHGGVRPGQLEQSQCPLPCIQRHTGMTPAEYKNLKNED